MEKENPAGYLKTIELLQMKINEMRNTYNALKIERDNLAVDNRAKDAEIYVLKNKPKKRTGWF